MPYPLSPFKNDFPAEKLLEPFSSDEASVIQNRNSAYLGKLLKWLCTAPQVTSYRANTLLTTSKNVQDEIASELKKLKKTNCLLNFPKIHPLLTEVVLLENLSEDCISLNGGLKEIIVDVQCAAAVLRGAHIYAPGVIGMELGIKKEDMVSIYADLSGKCLKGFLKKYDSPDKLFIGNGIAKMIRDDLFGEDLKPMGIAIQVTDTISHCPSIGDDFLPEGSALLQNLPSIVCSHVLGPKPGDVVLDMCASPGNKTTHLAALMKNEGILIAIDKTPAKLRQLQNSTQKFKANVRTFQADSTNILSHDKNINSSDHDILNGPPFPAETFDKILLDAPCSGLGKRPQLSNNITMKVLNSYVPLQRKLFRNAVDLLKKNGRLVYSTCTVTLGENEGMVVWALRTFSCLELVKAEPYLGGEGLANNGLSETQRSYVQRYGPDQNIDSVGFFIASFI